MHRPSEGSSIQEQPGEVTIAPSVGLECRIENSRRPLCDVCGAPMEPEHAHHRCPACGYVLPCCGW